MTTAIWIIAICEIIRLAQNSVQLVISARASGMKDYKRATEAFIRSLEQEMKDADDNERA